MGERQSDNPTKPELAILKLLWGVNEMSAREVHNNISEEFGWSYSTVRTVLERMFEKDLIAKYPVDGVNIYEAKVNKVAIIGRMIADFSKRVMELDTAPAAAFFSDSKLLSEEELTELEEMLRKEDEK